MVQDVNLEVVDVELSTEPLMAFFRIQVEKGGHRGEQWSVMKRYSDILDLFEAVDRRGLHVSLPRHIPEQALAQNPAYSQHINSQLKILLERPDIVSSDSFKGFFRLSDEYVPSGITPPGSSNVQGSSPMSGSSTGINPPYGTYGSGNVSDYDMRHLGGDLRRGSGSPGNLDISSNSSRPPTSTSSLSRDTVPPLRGSMSNQMYLLPTSQAQLSAAQVEVTVNVPLAGTSPRDRQVPDYSRHREPQVQSSRAPDYDYYRSREPQAPLSREETQPNSRAYTTPSRAPQAASVRPGGVYNTGSIVAEPGQSRISSGGYNTGSIVAERGQPNVVTPGGGGFAAAANSYLGSTATPFAPYQTHAPTPPGSVAPHQPGVRRESAPQADNTTSGQTYLLQATPEPARSTLHNASPGRNSPASLASQASSNTPDQQSPGVSRASGLSSSGGGGRRPYCVVCMAKPEEVAVDPCGHMAMCQGCASLVKECPVCRSPINKILKIFVVR